jgi:hypothetical protein
MFGKFLGKVISAPIKIVNLPIKGATRAMDWAMNEPSPRKNSVDKFAESVEDLVEDTFDE